MRYISTVSVVGIDLGTTNTVIGCVRAGKVHVLADEMGARLLPSVVSFHPSGEVLVGTAAKARRTIDAKNTVYSHKRLIGRSWGSPEIAQARRRFAFELREGPGQGPLVHARGQDYTLPEISAFVLRRARKIAEAALGTPVERAVITVPAHFNELQRASTKVAGRVSGLEVLRILNEPTAAALAYGLGRTGRERVAVYDFGGGTFDCTLLDLNGNVFEVLATAGDSFLGGDDVDSLIADRMAETFLKQHRQDARQDPQMYERLKAAAERVKIALSTAEAHTVVLDELGHPPNGGSSARLEFTLSRKDFDAMITPLVERSFKVTQDALALARLSPTSFDKVILVGGSTRLPLVRKRVEAFFGKSPMDRVNPDEVVAIGAAIQAAALSDGARRRSAPARPVAQRHATQGDARHDTQGDARHDAQHDTQGDAQHDTQGDAQHDTQGDAQHDTQGDAQHDTQGDAQHDTQGDAQRDTQDNTRSVVTDRPDLGATLTRASTAPGARAMAPGAAPARQPLPSSAPLSSGHTQPRLTSEPTFGGDARTLTHAARAPSASGANLGEIDDPASGAPTSRASRPSFPSASGAEMRAPAAQDPWPSGETNTHQRARPSLPEGQFGALPDLSLVSSSGVSSPRASSPSDGFGHVSDLSLIAPQAAGPPADTITNARSQALLSERLEDETLPAEGRPAREPDRLALLDRADLPSVAPRAKPARKPGHVGASKDASAMMGKGPPIIAPQPFGPMEKLEESPRSRTADAAPRLDAPPPPIQPRPPPSKAPPPTQPRAQHGRFNHTPPPSRSQPPPEQGSVQPALPTEAFGSLQVASPPAAAPRAFSSAPPPRAFSSAPPPRAFSSAPPPRAFSPAPPPRAFSSAPPPHAFSPAPPPHAFSSAPPPHAFSSAPPPHTFSSAPPPHAFSPAPPPHAFSSAPPPHAFSSAPPPHAFSSAPPPHAFSPAPPPHAFSPAPPPAFPHALGTGHGSAAPNRAASSAPQEGWPPANSDASHATFGAQHRVGAASTEPRAFGSFAPRTDASQPLDYAPGALDGSLHNPHLAQPVLTSQAPVLVDVTPRGLVVETAGGYTDTIIPRNSKIPCERTRRFATGRDMQTTVRVRVAQGEGALFPLNTYLGEVELAGIRPAPRGEVTVAVTFAVDADGTLQVRARDVQTGQEARATVQLIGVADESSVVTMINRFAQQPFPPGPERS